ncbi:MAG: alpha/beta hydrolase [Parvularculaceae bacterium]
MPLVNLGRAIGASFFLIGLTACAAESPNSENTSVDRARIEGFVTTRDGVDLYYVEQGAGPEVLVAPVALYLAPHLLEPLSENRRVIMYDTRHRGRSGAGDLANVSLDRQVTDLEDLRAALDIEEMAVLGWSGLGMEMAVYAMRYPDRVTRLIQMSPVPPAASMMAEFGDARSGLVDQVALDALDARNEAGEFEGRQEEYCRLRNALTDPSNFVDRALAREVPDVCIYENEWPENLWPFFGALLPSFGDYDWRDDIASLETPRLIIHGREDGIPVEGGRAWAAGYENARMVELSPAGHFPYIEQRDATLSAIETFLAGDWPANAAALPAQ